MIYLEILQIGSTGPNVELLQSTLQKIGYFFRKHRPVFSEKLPKIQLLIFNATFGLVPDGIVGTATWNALFPYLNGYTLYTVKIGDTLYNIANFFSTRINRILYANPNLEPNSISPGQKIIVPFSYVVPTNISYTYEIMQSNITALTRIYPFLQTESIGKSVLGKDLTVIRIGKGTKQVFYNASFHANEWITTPLLMKFVENFCISYVTNSEINGYNPRNIFDNVSIYIAPMINPDGVNLVTGAIVPSSPIYQQAQEIASNYPSIPFPARLES